MSKHLFDVVLVEARKEDGSVTSAYLTRYIHNPNSKDTEELYASIGGFTTHYLWTEDENRNTVNR